MSEHSMITRSKKNGGKGSRIDRVPAESLEHAKAFFMERKRMDEETFNKLYEVIEDEQYK